MSRSSPRPSSTGEKAPKNEGADGATTPGEGAGRSARRRHFKNHLAAWTRWIHIYLSMLGLATILFFGVTGVTLNHPDWAFGGAETVVHAEGKVDPRWLNPGAGTSAPATQPDAERPVMKLEIVEHLRKQHGIRGALSDFRADEGECTVTFKGPGYSADAFIDPETGRYKLTESRHGLVAVINDLHKGRDTGRVWAIVIDVSAILMIVVSLTGLVLLFYIKRRRVSGLVVGVAGTVALAAFYWYFVP